MKPFFLTARMLPTPGLAWLLIAGLLLCASCGQSGHFPQRGFYYWKSDPYSLTDREKNYLYRTKPQKLYVKMFEIEPNPTFGFMPVAKTSLHLWRDSPDTVLGRIEIIPVIYLKNEALRSARNSALDSLADNMLFLTTKYYANFHSDSDYKALQIDCDWTATTKDAYFHLLRALRKASRKKIYCTLRLYPYKYSEKMGVPPVDRATLMCYNLINPLTQEAKNSILDLKELKSYLTRRSDYPLPLDIALPAYSWMQVYHNNHFEGVLYKNNNDLLSILRPEKPLWYELMQDTVIDNLYLRRGDKLKYEQGTPQLAEAINLLKSRVPADDDATLTFFHLDDQLTKDLPYEKLDSLYRLAAGR